MAKFLRSFKFAAQGITHFMAVLVIINGFIMKISVIEWSIIIILLGGMLALELVNTAIERMVDLATEEFHLLAKQAKDTAAGAVLVFAIASAVIGLLIFMPKWLMMLN